LLICDHQIKLIIIDCFPRNSSLWKSQDVSYVKVEELSIVEGITFLNLYQIPNFDEGGVETLYAIDSEDVADMLVFKVYSFCCSRHLFG
jgi:hypothetical protein